MNKNTRKNIISALITILILSLGIGAFLRMKAMKKSTVSDRVVKKERRTVKFETFPAQTEVNLIEIDGRLSAYEAVNLTSKVQGIMMEGPKSVRAGKYFKKGDLLFTIDSREASYNLKASKSALMTSITQMMPDIKFDYPDAYPSWLDYLKAFEVDKALAPLPEPSSEQERYFVSGRNVYNQYYSIKSQETRLSEYKIYAPFSGVITSVNVYPGSLINANQTLGQMINTSLYELYAPVPLEDLQYIQVGQQVNLYAEGLKASWQGKVSRIGSQIDPNTQNLPLYISVRGKGLKDGMYLKGELKGQALEEVKKLPKSIFINPSSVYVIEDSTLVAKTIQPIQRTDQHVIVKGLGDDEKVVVGSLAGLFEGQKVNY